MTTLLIIVCVVFCAAIVLAIVGHLGFAIPKDTHWRAGIRRHHARRPTREGHPPRGQRTSDR